MRKIQIKFYSWIFLTVKEITGCVAACNLRLFSIFATMLVFSSIFSVSTIAEENGAPVFESYGEYEGEVNSAREGDGDTNRVRSEAFRVYLNRQSKNRSLQAAASTNESLFMELEPVQTKSSEHVQILIDEEGEHHKLESLKLDRFYGHLVQEFKVGTTRSVPISLVRYEGKDSAQYLGSSFSQDVPLSIEGRSVYQERTSFVLEKSTVSDEDNSTCGHADHAHADEFSLRSDIASRSSAVISSQDNGQLNVVELALIHDCKSIAQHGGLEKYRVWNASILNRINYLYETQVNTTFKVVYEEFYESCAADPYQASELGNIRDLLDAVRLSSRTIMSEHPHDILHLISARSTTPVSFNGYASVGNLCTSLPAQEAAVGVVKDYIDSFFTANVFAHELGHNLGANHLAGCNYDNPSTLYIMCPATGSSKISARSIENFNESLSRNCVDQEAVASYGSRPYYDFTTTDHNFESFLTNGTDEDDSYFILYEGLPFQSSIPIFDQNHDIVSVKGFDTPDIVSIDSDSRSLSAFLPRNCSADPTQQTLTTFSVVATDATDLSAVQTFDYKIRRNPFRPEVGIFRNYAYLGQTFRSQYTTGSYPDLTFFTSGNDVSNSTQSIFPPSVTWTPTEDQMGVGFFPNFRTTVCDETYIGFDFIYALPGPGIPVFRQPIGSPIRVVEGQRREVPLQWVGDSQTPSPVNLNIVNPLPPEVTRKGDMLIIEPDKDSVVPCYGGVNGTRTATKDIKISINAFARFDKQYTSDLNIQIVDTALKPKVNLTGSVSYLDQGDILEIPYEATVPDDGSSYLVIDSAASGVEIDTEQKVIRWKVNFDDPQVAQPLSRRRVNIALTIQSCGGESARDEFVVYEDRVSTPSPTPFVPLPSPTVFPTPIDIVPEPGIDLPSSSPTPIASPVEEPELVVSPKDQLLAVIDFLKRLRPKTVSSEDILNMEDSFSALTISLFDVEGLSERRKRRRDRVVAKITRSLPRLSSARKAKTFRKRKKRIKSLLRQLLRYV